MVLKDLTEVCGGSSLGNLGSSLNLLESLNNKTDLMILKQKLSIVVFEIAT